MADGICDIDETHRPDFGQRLLEKIADEDILSK